MPDMQSERPHFRAPDEPDVLGYRAISGLALVALLAGLGSSIAMMTAPPGWVLPLGGIALSIAALRRVKRYAPVLLGRKAALVGLALSTVFLVAAPTAWFVYRWQVEKEARQFGALWFDYLRNNEPHKAVQLREHPTSRQPLDDLLWQFYPEHSESRGQLEGFVREKGIRTLLALGDRATVRYYDTESQEALDGRDAVHQVYAVTFQLGGEPTTFFIGLYMERIRVPAAGRAYWRLLNRADGMHPRALGGPGM
jgi:hypothetical protein